MLMVDMRIGEAASLPKAPKICHGFRMVMIRALEGPRAMANAVLCGQIVFTTGGPAQANNLLISPGLTRSFG